VGGSQGLRRGERQSRAEEREEAVQGLRKGGR